MYLLLLKFTFCKKEITLPVLILLTKSVLRLAKFNKNPAGGKTQMWESRNWNNTELIFQVDLHVSAPCRIESSTYRPPAPPSTSTTTIRLLAANCYVMQSTPPYLLFLSSLPLYSFIHRCSHTPRVLFSAFLWLTSPILPPYVVIIDCLATTGPHPYTRQYLFKKCVASSCYHKRNKHRKEKNTEVFGDTRPRRLEIITDISEELAVRIFRVDYEVTSHLQHCENLTSVKHGKYERTETEVLYLTTLRIYKIIHYSADGR